MGRHPLALVRLRRSRRPVVLALGAVCLAIVVSGNPSGFAEDRSSSLTESVSAPGPEVCTDVVAGISLRDQLAQHLMPGVGADGPGSADDPAAVRDVVRTTHVGGLFLGGNGLTLLTEPTLRAIRSAGPVPAAVAVDDEGGRVQRIDGIFGNLPSARCMGPCR